MKNLKQDRERRIAMGELTRAMGLALETDSDEVKNFAQLLLARVAALAEGASPEPLAADDVALFVELYDELCKKRGVDQAKENQVGPIR